MTTTSSPGSSRRSERGFTLLELLVAMAVFTLVILAAFQVFERSHEGYRRGNAQAEMIQNARVGFDQMTNDVRMAGFEFDIDGSTSLYPDQPDEAIEYMGASVITVRANFNFDQGNLRGREAGLERIPPAGADSVDGCCPIVTTSNKEIVTYALSKDTGASDMPSESVVLRFDSTGTTAIEAPDEDGVYADGDIRDGYIDEDGVIHDEEDVTIADIAVTDFSDPPYVLYKFTVNDDGTVNRSPFVDNVKSIEFKYYSEDDTELAPNGGLDAGRDLRWDVKRVKVSLVAMEPEADRRWTDKDDTNPKSQHNRKYTLVADVRPPNMGRRGQIDKSVNVPAPVTTVTVCTGQCGTVRVSWVPPPPEDRIKDYIVQLFSGVPLADLSNRIASFVVVSNFDILTNQEYGVFTREDDGSLDDGVVIYARVIARNDGGAESPPTDSASGVAIASNTRPDAVQLASGTGYDPTGAQWPDAANDNSGAATIETSPDDGGDPPVENANFPQANFVRIAIKSPQFTLNDNPSAPGPPRWTTQDIASGGVAPLSCHKQEASPSVAGDELRTPLDNMPRNSRTPNTYVFRVSGSEEDKWSWDGGLIGATVTDPRNFIPGPENLHDFTWLALHTESVTYTDLTDSVFVTPAGATDQYDDRFDTTKTRVTAWTPTGAAAATWENRRGGTVGNPKALVPGEVYYYRFRVVSLCWEDDNKDGVHDDYAADAGLTAWSLREDVGDDATWRTRSLSISPFYPPLIPAGSGSGQKDQPDQTVYDSDEVTRAGGLDCYAIPGYAIGAASTEAGVDYIRPEKPTELYLARSVQGDESDDSVQLMFNASKRNAPAVAEGSPQAVAYARYELHRIAATSASPSAADKEFTPDATTLFLRFRTDGPLSLKNYTLDSGATSSPYHPEDAGEDAPNAFEYPDPGVLDHPDTSEDSTTEADWQLEEVTKTGGFPWIWRLVTIANGEFDDGITPDTKTSSEASRPFVFPCDFYDKVSYVDIAPAVGSGTETSVAVSVSMNDDLPPMGAPDPTCATLASGRLLAYRIDGEYVGTSDWVDVTGDCDFTFDAAAISKARREYTGLTRYVVEVADTINAGATGTGPASGCMVRSDRLGWSYESPSSEIGCAADCGTNASPGILGTVDDTRVQEGDTSSILEIHLDNLCQDKNFALHQIEVDLERATGDALPVLVTATLEGTTDGTITLPVPDVEAPFADPSLSKRLRWYGALSADYPIIDKAYDDIVLYLAFAGSACDVTVSSFNFRVRVAGETDGESNELLCTNRGGGDPDPDPVVGGLASGEGRGPQVTPAISCIACDPECGDGECPLNDDLGIPTDVELLDSDESGIPQSLVRVNYQETCLSDTDCNMPIDAVRIHVKTNALLRDCGIAWPGGALPNPGNGAGGGLGIGRFRVIRGGSTIDLDLHLLPPTVWSESDCDLIYQWDDLPGFHIEPGESFTLDLHFYDDMSNTEFDELTVSFDSPLPSPVTCTHATPIAIPTP